MCVNPTITNNCDVQVRTRCGNLPCLWQTRGLYAVHCEMDNNDCVLDIDGENNLKPHDPLISSSIERKLRLWAELARYKVALRSKPLHTEDYFLKQAVELPFSLDTWEALPNNAQGDLKNRLGVSKRIRAVLLPFFSLRLLLFIGVTIALSTVDEASRFNSGIYWDALSALLGLAFGLYMVINLFEETFFGMCGVIALSFDTAKIIQDYWSVVRYPLKIGVTAIAVLSLWRTLVSFLDYNDTDVLTNSIETPILHILFPVIFLVVVHCTFRLLYRYHATTNISKQFGDQVVEIVSKERLLRYLCKSKKSSKLFSSSMYLTEPDETAYSGSGVLSSVDYCDLPYSKACRMLLYVQDHDAQLPVIRETARAPKHNSYSWVYSDEFSTRICNEEEVEVIGRVIFRKIDINNAGSISFADWMVNFSSFIDSATAWNLLFHSKFEIVNEAAFVTAMKILLRERQYLGASLRDWQSLNVVLERFVLIAVWIISVMLVIVSSGVSVSSALATFGTLLISTAVAFGSTLKNIVESAVLIVLIKPFRVGDRIQLDSRNDTPKLVQKIQLLSTTFKGPDNRVLIIPNKILADKQIFNLRESKHAVVLVEFEIEATTSEEKLKELKYAIAGYLNENDGTRHTLHFYVNDVGQVHSLTLHIWFQSNLSWDQSFPLKKMKGEFSLFVIRQMESLDITYTHAVVPFKTL